LEGETRQAVALNGTIPLLNAGYTIIGGTQVQFTVAPSTGDWIMGW
jgi:hypothetical protein